MTNLQKLEAAVAEWNKKKEQAQREMEEAKAELQAFGVTEFAVDTVIADLRLEIAKDEQSIEREAGKLLAEINERLAEFD